MIKMFYSAEIKDKMKAIIAEAEKAVPIVQDENNIRRRDRDLDKREEWVQARYGLTLNYLQGVVRGTYEQPSTRVLNNLGFLVQLKDLDTGKVHTPETIGRWEIERYQKMKADSIS